ncbi:Gfo/Idh/MocA family oxidoreductase [Viridibacterium curvum]|uniref:Gfo/Idh/MocA family oxidoreductase n=1 Tax=Viridibacterium curvum TaxID=1101404 RepID=A0ABP9QDF8_9RHOO
MSTQVRWGILGYARIARLSAIPAILRAGNAELSAIASRDAAKLAECATQFPLARLHMTYDALLADPDVDAIYVPLPNSQHRDWTIAALEAGKHVLCEKPIALTARQARDMGAAAKHADRLLMEAFMYRYTDRIRQVRTVLASGELGVIRHVNASFRFFLDRENTIKEQAGLGGGALYDVGCYPINLLGLITEKLPVRCQAYAEMKGGVDVNLSALLQYGDGMIANLHCGFNAHPFMHAEVIGTQGRLEIRDTFTDAAGELYVYTTTGTRSIAVAESDRYGAEFRDFSAAILEGRTPLLTLEESIRNMEVLDMIRESLP